MLVKNISRPQVKKKLVNNSANNKKKSTVKK